MHGAAARLRLTHALVLVVVRQEPAPHKQHVVLAESVLGADVFDVTRGLRRVAREGSRAAGKEARGVMRAVDGCRGHAVWHAGATRRAGGGASAVAADEHGGACVQAS